MTSASIIKSLGASEIDTAELVTNLVAATKEPRQKLIDGEKNKADVAISSTALIKNALLTLQSAATELGSVSKLNKLSVSSTYPSIVTATPSSSGVATPANYEVIVNNLAKPKRLVTDSLAAGFLTSGTTLALSRDGAALGEITIPAGSTPAQIVSLVNSDPTAKDNYIKATLIDTGEEIPYKIILEGRPGEENDFTVGETGESLGLSNAASNTLSAAEDAELVINSILIRRPTNSISDVISGVSFQLNSVSASAVQVGVAADTMALTEKVRNFVDAYNLVSEIVTSATGPSAEGDEVAGSLRTDSAARSIKTKLRQTITAESSSSSGAITHWNALGVEFDRNGVLQLDEAKFATTFQENAEDAIRALSNNSSSPYIFSGQSSGLAGDIAVEAYGMIRSTGLIEVMNAGYQSKLQRIEKKQDDLDRYVERITAQYERQFSALNGILAAFKDTQNQLERSLNFSNKD